MGHCHALGLIRLTLVVIPLCVCFDSSPCASLWPALLVIPYITLFTVSGLTFSSDLLLVWLIACPSILAHVLSSFVRLLCVVALLLAALIFSSQSTDFS